jgi:NADPH:quinone reductase-like Zn-dependent oxidoreductase
MKAAIVDQAGQAPRYGDFPEPQAAPDEVRIQVIAAALTPLARARVAGTHYSADGSYPFIAGVDGVGRLGDGTRAFFVMPRAPQGAMAEQVTVPNGQWAALPDNLDDETAAAIANAGVSSWAALTERAHLKAGETVLVNGATGASGQLAVRIARHLGASRVIATGRNQAILETLGADAVVRLDGEEEGIKAAMSEHFAAGIDVVLDYLWGPSARALLLAAAAGRRGQRVRFVQVGSIAGEEIALPAGILRSSRIELIGSGIGSLSLTQLMSAAEAMFAGAEEAGLAIAFRVVPLADVATAWDAGKGERLIFTIA